MSAKGITDELVRQVATGMVERVAAGEASHDEVGAWINRRTH